MVTSEACLEPGQVGGNPERLKRSAPCTRGSAPGMVPNGMGAFFRRFCRSRLWLGLLVGVGGVLPTLLACTDKELGNSKLPEGVRSNELKHEVCESGSKVEETDTNGDGKPDIRVVYDKAGHQVCRASDLDHDGKPDFYSYFDSSGQVRRRESVVDDTGVVAMIEQYEGGKLVRREYDLSQQHKIDTWDTYDPATGQRLRRERDSKGTGRVDQWWTYEGDKIVVAYDRDGDGKPDPNDQVTTGSSNAAPSASSAAKGVPTDAGPLSTATQIGAGAASPPPEPPSTVGTAVPELDAGPPAKKAPSPKKGNK